MYLKTLSSLALVACLGCSGAVMADEPEDQVKYRKAVMKVVGGHMGGIVAILKGKISADHMVMHAQGMNAAAIMTKEIFPEGSGEGETRAKAEVWSKPDEFQQAVQKFETAAADFLAAAESGDKGQIGQAMKGLGGSCKGCHDDFRQKKK